MFIPTRRSPTACTAKGRSPHAANRSTPKKGRWTLRYDAMTPPPSTRTAALKSRSPSASSIPKTTQPPPAAGGTHPLRRRSRDRLGQRPGLLEAVKAVARQRTFREHGQLAPGGLRGREPPKDGPQVDLRIGKRDVHLHAGNLHANTLEIVVDEVLQHLLSATLIWRCLSLVEHDLLARHRRGGIT